MTDPTPQGAAHVTDAQINAARTKPIIDIEENVKASDQAIG